MKRPNPVRDTKRWTQDPRPKTGSALILAVVLTSLLAIIGVMFLLSSRVDWVGTSSIADSKDLGSAVDTVVAQISEELSLDVPGAPKGQEYYDYPDINNPWLACLEPYDSGTGYRWRHITDVNDTFWAYQNSLNIPAYIIPDYQDRAQVRDSNTTGGLFPADADGDGVSDSMWVQVPNISSGKGKPIYVAIRIIDNGGMLNANTGYVFDPCSSVGTSQFDINLVSLSWRPNDPNALYELADTDYLLKARSPASPYDFVNYEGDVIWKYENPNGSYTPFDISDELEMRYRFLLNQTGIDTRVEEWGGEFRKRVNSTPYGTGDIGEWFKASCIDANASNLPPDRRYAYRHIATTYNLDRVINPLGQKMVNINTEPNVIRIRDTILAGFIDANVTSDVNVLNGWAAQITANLIDYLDSDSTVTEINDDANIPHFGFETPCIYISEIAECNIRSGTYPFYTYIKAYAIELYKPYWDDPVPSSDPCNGWQLVVGSNPPIDINWTGSNRFHVIRWGAAEANMPVEFNDVNGVDANAQVQKPLYLAFSGGEFVQLQRRVVLDGNVVAVTVDYVRVPDVCAAAGWLVYVDSNSPLPKVHSYQRDISPNKPIRRLWDFAFSRINSQTLGYDNGFTNTASPEVIQAHPANHQFTNVGEFGQLFYNNTYSYGGILLPRIGVTEPEMRIDLNEPAYQQVFKYLTVMDPTRDGIDNDGDGLIDEQDEPNTPELKIKGRININTAPWFVLAQLPWVSYHTQPNYNLARSIVDYRNNNGAFKSIGELMNVNDPNSDVNSIGYYASQPFASIPSFLMTPKDGTVNEDAFEKRDVIFARISNLVTVRSDVFTAYILVRIGADGPQKRVIAIFDRSGVYPNPSGGYTGKVKILAIQPVPDPR